MSTSFPRRFFTFRQNNSGGGFDVSNDLAMIVVIEAESYGAALGRAEDLGIYFNGVSKGMDCSCCGDRWYEPWDEDGSEWPSTGYDDPITSLGESSLGGDGARIHFYGAEKPVAYSGLKEDRNNDYKVIHNALTRNIQDLCDGIEKDRENGLTVEQSRVDEVNLKIRGYLYGASLHSGDPVKASLAGDMPALSSEPKGGGTVWPMCWCCGGMGCSQC